MAGPRNISTQKPLAGIRVLEMGQLVAGPFASALLAWFGAEVIKIEPPVIGDPIRTWRAMYKGTSLWWYALGRNKKSVTINLRDSSGQDLVRQLVPLVDVIVENFRPGTMEKWGLGFEDLQAINPRLIMARVSGWGQTGPYAHKPGFASVAEAAGGFRHLNGYSDRPPVRTNLSLGDSIAGLHAALGILAAVYHRDTSGSGKGQVVDVAIYESVFNLLEGIIPEYDKLGIVRECSGSTLSGIVPTGTYLCGDGKYVVIGGNGNSIFKRLCHAIDRSDMADDNTLADNAGRVAHQQEIEDAIAGWTLRHTSIEVRDLLENADVPVGLIYSVADMVNDPQFIARGLFENVTLPDGSSVKLPSVVPKLSETPGTTEWIGPALGEHNREVLGGWLDISEEKLQELATKGIIAPLETTTNRVSE